MWRSEEPEVLLQKDLAQGGQGECEDWKQEKKAKIEKIIGESAYWCLRKKKQEGGEQAEAVQECQKIKHKRGNESYPKWRAEDHVCTNVKVKKKKEHEEERSEKEIWD